MSDWIKLKPQLFENKKTGNKVASVDRFHIEYETNVCSYIIELERSSEMDILYKDSIRIANSNRLVTEEDKAKIIKELDEVLSVFLGPYEWM